MSWQEVGFCGEVDESLPEAEETERVDRIMAEAEAPDYWFAASRDGNRESHYRGNLTSAAAYLRSGNASAWNVLEQQTCLLVNTSDIFYRMITR